MIRLSSEEYPELDYSPYALIDTFDNVIKEIILAQGAAEALKYFNKHYPTRDKFRTIWILVGGEPEDGL